MRKAILALLALGLLGCELDGRQAAVPTPSPEPSFAPGTRWEVIAEPSYLNMTALDYVNAQDAWAVGGDAAVARSGDGGKTWATPQALPSTPIKLDHASLSFVDPRFGFVGGSYGVFKTTDGGASWTGVPPFTQENGPPPNDQQALVKFRDYEHGVVLWRGEMHRTMDGGKTWKATAPGAGSPRRLGMIGNEFAVLTDADLWVSKPDGGWEALPLPTTFDPEKRNPAYHDFCFLDAQNGWVTGPGIYRTTDGGKKWIALANLEGALRIHFLDAARGWALAGRSWKATRTGGATWVDVPYQAYGGDSRNVPTGFEVLDPANVFVFTGTGVVRKWIAP